jgi:hypothetical protein
MQGLGGADEDGRGGFERGRWALPLFDDKGASLVNEGFQRADAFLFGRWTYELFAGYWGAITDPANPIAASLNAQAQVRGIDHAKRPAMGGHDPPVR